MDLIDQLVPFQRLGLFETAHIITGVKLDELLFRSPLELIRHVIVNKITDDIIGVQPMTGPIGQIFTLGERYGKH